MLSKIVRIFIIFLSVTLVVYCCLFYTLEIDKYLNFSKSGVVSSTINGPEGNLVFTRIDTIDFVSRPYPRINDKLLTIDDTTATSRILDRYFNSPVPIGKTAGITYLSGPDTLKTTVRMRPLTGNQLWAQAILMFMRFLISISYIAVGMWAFSKRPDSGAVRSLTLFCYSMASLLMTVITMIGGAFTTFKIPGYEILRVFIGNIAIFLGAFWLNLQLLFPAPRPIVRKHPIIVYLSCYLPILALIGAIAILRSQLIGYAIIGVLTAQIVVGFLMLGRLYRYTKEALEKRQIRLVLRGTGIGLVILGLFIAFAAVASGWLQRLPEYSLMGIIMVIFLCLLLSPLSIAYAFGKYRLLEIEGRIRRGTQHFIIGLALLALFYLLVYIVSNFTLQILHIDSRTPVLISALVLAIGFAPAQRKLLGQLDKRIYPERFRLRSILNDFLTQAQGTTDKKAFWDGLENRLKAALKVDSVYPINRTSEGNRFVLRDGSVTPFESDSAFMGAIAGMGGRPLMRDELEANTKITFNRDERDWLTEHHIALVLPLVTHSELIGLLCIGSKSERQDFESADLEVLKSLSNQIAIAADNLTLLEENVEKKRLESELTFARQVQEKMLPGDIPDTAALEIAAVSKFCTEVAGDYYDIIDAGDGRTVLAIGDVSGKGAAAALLMSNVQASLRTAIGIESQTTSARNQSAGENIRLTNIVANINSLIYHNSQPEQFITFFVAIFDPKTYRLDYINAGHNPPLAASIDGKITELTEGGIILGVMPEMPYKRGSIQLGKGDMIFLYTDGLSESTRADDEMFGEERIKEFLAANRKLNPRQFLEKLEEEVSIFIGDSSLTDDFTLVSVEIK